MRSDRLSMFLVRHPGRGPTQVIRSRNVSANAPNGGPQRFVNLPSRSRAIQPFRRGGWP